MKNVKIKIFKPVGKSENVIDSRYNVLRHKIYQKVEREVNEKMMFWQELFWYLKFQKNLDEITERLEEIRKRHNLK